MPNFQREHLQQLLYGAGPAVRFTQDTPVLPDVWMAYAENPGAQVDLILTPTVDRTRTDAAGGRLAAYLKDRLSSLGLGWAPQFSRDDGAAPGVAANESSVAARLYLDELVRLVLPVSGWWQRSIAREYGDISGELADPRVREILVDHLCERQPRTTLQGLQGHSGRPSDDLLWMLRVVGTIAYAHEQLHGITAARERKKRFKAVWPPAEGNRKKRYYAKIVAAVLRLFEDLDFNRLTEGLAADPHNGQLFPLVHRVSRNREANITVWRSGVAVKSDAARRLFQLDCGDLTWAIIDDGVDARHLAFRRRDPEGKPLLLDEDWTGQTRVLATYDFTCIRELLSDDPEDGEHLPSHVRQRFDDDPHVKQQLRESLNRGRVLEWPLVLPLIEMSHDAAYQEPRTEHGTHVAGIFAGDWRQSDALFAGEEGDFPFEFDICGICPDINIYDLRVIDENGRGNEFNVMSALQFVRHLNAHSNHMRVHGANISLSIKHDVVNYACGRTPVCDECARLVGDGITVVAAAGNEGYEQPSGLSPFARYQDISITDPGNAEEVITVGATHRDSPHYYGVSYFSSRGPTGDGRAKPDLVAPGEKIESTVPGNRSKRMDGTSMAAPHVSGAAALLMARHGELIGEPRKIKQILCATATDLGRERYFQGAGMVDILRGLQSV